MATPDDLSSYLEHLGARVRARQKRPTRDDAERNLTALPPSIATLCSTSPLECFKLILRALEQLNDPEQVRAAGEGLLQDLLNEQSAKLDTDVVRELRANKRFRQAFACGNHASVDPALADEWMEVLRSLGTTKATERKSLWKKEWR